VPPSAKDQKKILYVRHGLPFYLERFILSDFHTSISKAWFMYFALDSISIQWRWKSMGEVRRYIRLDSTAAIHLVDHKHCNDHEYKFRLLDLGVSFR